MSTNSSEPPIDPSAWMSQVEAASLRGVSRQAISKLIRKGRLRTLDIGGHIFVYKADVEQFISPTAGRPKQSPKNTAKLTQIQQLLHGCSFEERHQLFHQLRQEFPIHPLEQEFHAPAELILEAIARSPDISKRGVRGLIAEASFELYIVRNLTEWLSLPVPNESSYDFVLRDSIGDVRIQVKTQRRKSEFVKTLHETAQVYRPMKAREASRSLPEDMFVVETQRTRGGKNALGEKTRPYRFDEFDILAVSMYPSTQVWDKFMFTVSRWLLPRPEDQRQLQVFQPVAKTVDEAWTDDFATCVSWLRSNTQRSVLSVTYPETE